MRFTPATLALALCFAMVSSVGVGQRADAQIAPLSLAWTNRGDAMRAAGDLSGAIDAYESALAADPRNRAAFIALGDIARQQALPGKAIGLYNEALVLDPTDVAVLAVQGLAMLDKGGVAQAQANLDRMKAVCRSDCPQIAVLAAALAKAGAQAPTPPPATK